MKKLTHKILWNREKELSEDSLSFRLTQVVVVFFLVFSFFGCFLLRAPFPSESEISLSIQSAKKSIWKIESPLDSGTGFFIGPRLFVTSFHVVSSMLKSRSVKDITLFQEESPVVLRLNRILSISALHDLALIETKDSVSHYLTLGENLLKSEESLFILGYPQGKFKQIKKVGNILFTEYNFYSFAVNHSNLFGISGSPVFNNKGHVTGVAFQSTENMLCAINLNHLKSFIKRDRGLNCSDFESLNSCMERELENFVKLAEQGSSLAQYYLGLMHYHGEGFKRDLKKAFAWTAKAARKGGLPAQFGLGYMYYRGEGIKRDFQKASLWLRQAAGQGYILAQYYLGDIYFTGGEGIKKDFQKALSLWTEAAEQGLSIAQFRLIGMYSKGEGVEKNLGKARFWYEKFRETL